MKVVIVAYDIPGRFKAGDAVLLLGEIENMPGHVAVAGTDGKVHWAYHEDSFREATEDEL